MPRRTLTVMALAAALVFAVNSATAGGGAGHQTHKSFTATFGVMAASKTVRHPSPRLLSIRRKTAIRWWSRKLHRYQQTAWSLEKLMDRPLSRVGRQLSSSGLQSLVMAAKTWQRIDRRTWVRYRHPPHLSDWLCIQSGIKGGRWSPTLDYLGGGYRVGSGEGSWTDHGPTYDGGLQMDRKFQERYGAQLLNSKGTADKWTGFEQIWTAVNAYRTRGFTPWPNTARDCGLLT